MEPARWQQICDLYSEVLELSAPDRAALLAERCRGDQQLRSEVDSLLAMRSKRGLLDSEIHRKAGVSSNREALPPGTRLGPYEIISTLGAGGMGTVYRARDGRVGREVAIKFSAQQFTERFEREARVVASLNHPNICQLYDVGPDYLVMELIAGESPKGPLALDEVLRICEQIAEALEYAHEKGVIHRDLKPANIKVTPDGAVKVLDFGLAKVIEQTTAGADLENSPTATMTATGAGVILGTAAYMAPEQASGKPVDRRADIWAFGAVFYELYTGRRPFRGDGVVEILASILKHEPDWNTLPADTPPRIGDLLRWCLEKDRRQRLQSIGDARILLGRTGETAAHPRSNPWLTWATCAVLALAGIAGWLRTGRVGNELPGIALTMVSPLGSPLSPVGSQVSTPEISPDGSAVLYTARGGYYVRRLDSLESQQVPGSEAATGGGFWSPDSTTVVYPSTRGLIKVRIPNGVPQIVTPLSGPSRGGSWSERGSILISTSLGTIGSGMPLGTVPAAGGQLVKVDIPGLRPGGYKNPEFLPGGKDFLFLFVPSDNGEDTEVCLATLRNGKGINPVCSMKNPTAAHFTAAGGGRLLFVQRDNLYSQKLNVTARRLEGEAELVVRGVASQPDSDVGRADFSVARNGVVAWRPGKAALNQVTIFDRQGSRVGIMGPPGTPKSLALSPDETRILFSSQRGWILDVGQPGRLTLPADADQWIGWSPDGAKVLAVGARNNLLEMSATGSGEVRDLGRVNIQGVVDDLSPDGIQALSYGRGGLWVTPLAAKPEERLPRVVLRSEGGASYPRFSPDGRWILYSSGGLFVQPFPGPGRRLPVAPFGGLPEWRRDGKEIVFLGRGGIMSVAVDSAGGQLRFGPAQMLFSGVRLPSGMNASDRPLAVSRDGSRIYFAEGAEQPDSNMIHIKMDRLK